MRKFLTIFFATTVALVMAFAAYIAAAVRGVLKHQDEVDPYEWYDWDDEEDHDPAPTTSDATVYDLRGRAYRFNQSTKHYEIFNDKETNT
jgi:hypothetical protein